jgi:large subunit ribosomal protein L29
MMKANELRDQSVEELEATVRDTRKELFEVINEYRQSKKVEKPHLLRHKRRDIARALTVLREKQIQANV